MRKAEVIHLLDYMNWVNGRLLDAAARLPTDRLTDPDPRASSVAGG